MVGTHLPFCHRCEAASRLGEAMGGALLANMPNAGLAPDRVTRTLAALRMPAVQAIADLLESLDRAIRNIRVLVRRASIAVRIGEEVPAHYVDLISSLAEVTAEIADRLGERRLATGSRPALSAIARSSSDMGSQVSL